MNENVAREDPAGTAVGCAETRRRFRLRPLRKKSSRSLTVQRKGPVTKRLCMTVSTLARAYGTGTEVDPSGGRWARYRSRHSVDTGLPQRVSPCASLIPSSMTRRKTVRAIGRGGMCQHPTSYRGRVGSVERGHGVKSRPIWVESFLKPSTATMKPVSACSMTGTRAETP